MQNEMVVRRVGKHLEVGQLQTLRNISRLWSDTFTEELKSKFLQQADSPVKLNGRSSGQLKEFSATISESSPFVYLSICNVDCASTSRTDFRNFFGIHGATLQRLSLHLSSSLDRKTFNVQNLRKIIFEDTPNLVDLELVINQRERANQSWSSSTQQHSSGGGGGGGGGGGLQLQRVMSGQLGHLRKFVFKTKQRVGQATYDLIQDILQVTNQLKSFTFHSCSSENVQQVLLYLRDSYAHLDQLEVLSISQLESEQLLVLMVEIGYRLHLQEMDLGVCLKSQSMSVGSTDTIYEMLRTQSSTLKVFKIRLQDERRDSRADLQIPDLPHLEHFRVDRQSLSRLNISYVDNGLPSLTSYTYQCSPPDSLEHQAEEFTHTIMDGVCAEGVTDLTMAYYLPPQPLTGFSTSFPHVSTLNVSLTIPELYRYRDGSSINNCFAPIWTSWPLLISLTISLHRNGDHPVYEDGRNNLDLDEALTGIEELKFPALGRELVSTMCLTRKRVDSLLGAYKTKPGLSDLKHLQKFTLNVYDSVCDGCKITDICGYFGVAVNSDLQEVRIKNQTPGCGGGNSMCSHQCERFIRRCLGPFAIIEL